MPSADTSPPEHPDNLKPPPPAKDAVAVALHQENETDRAPKVVAGGRGRVAEQILEIAFAQGIKVREDADLAQLLHAVDDDTEIPTEAFAAVAEILVYLYQANGEPMPGNEPPRPGEPGAAAKSVKEIADELAKKWHGDEEDAK